VKVLAATQLSLVIQRNILAVICGLALSSNLCTAIYLMQSQKQTILVPAYLSSDVTLSQHHLSKGYLEEMSGFFLSKLLDITNHNIAYQHKIVLRHIHPSFYKQMEKFFLAETARYKEYNLHTYFALRDLKIDEKNLEVIASGTLINQFGTTGTSEEQVTYLLGYNYSGGLLTINKFSLVKEEVSSETK
jgi:type IV conjugative transfer system protein TraE